MNRRELLVLVGSALAAARPVPAQQKAMPVIGFLSSITPSELLLAAFHQGLSENGYVEGKNLAIEYRSAEGQYNRLPALAADLVGRKVDVIVTLGGASSALTAKDATSTIPIIFSVGDAVERGLVGSLARPGGNLTGVSQMSTELPPKRLELLSDLVPDAGVIALLVNPDNPGTEPMIREVQEAARSKGLQLPILRASAGARSTPLSPPSAICEPARCWSAAIHSLTATAKSWWRWRRAMPFRRSMSGVSPQWPAA